MRKKKLKDEESCSHKDVAESDWCAFCGASSGICNDCDEMVAKEAGGEWELE